MISMSQNFFTFSKIVGWGKLLTVYTCNVYENPLYSNFDFFGEGKETRKSCSSAALQYYLNYLKLKAIKEMTFSFNGLKTIAQNSTYDHSRMPILLTHLSVFA